MAQDWMKVELHTPEKPSLLVIAAKLGHDHYAVLGRFIKFWAWADRQTSNGRLPGITFEAIDLMLGMPGFSEAAASEDWLGRDDRGVYIPRFTKHNGKSAKKRALTARRVAACKARAEAKRPQKGNAFGNAGGNAQVTLGALPRQTVRVREREEKNSDCSPLPPNASLTDCLTAAGVGEPARSVLAACPTITADEVRSEWASIAASNGRARKPIAVLVSTLAKRHGITLPKRGGHIGSDVAAANAQLLRLRENRQ